MPQLQLKSIRTAHLAWSAGLCLLIWLFPAAARAHVGHDDTPTETRNWRLIDGSTVNGGFLALNGDQVVLRSAVGDTTKVSIARLAAADRQWVTDRADASRAQIADVREPPPAPPAAVPAAPPHDIGSIYGWAGACAIGAVLAMSRLLAGRRMSARPIFSAVSLLACSGGLFAAAADDAKPEAPAIQKAFTGFRNKVHADAQYLYVESDGLPDHGMMKGIRAWQQQVPLPQAYTGENAWRIPLHPKLAEKPISGKKALYRGAIALAVNGVPIFNALNNRGEDAQAIGELDEWGGHCGRADDYHYHAAPLHLQKIVGKEQPIAYALDGFPIYGLTNPDGSPVGKLDEFNGKIGPDGTYRYHATLAYPYINGGLRGEVQVRNDGVEPQPRASPVRPALPPLRGATITDFKSPEKNRFELSYEVGGRKASIAYAINADGTYPFKFKDVDGTERDEIYRRRAAGGPQAGAGEEPRGPRQGDRPPRDENRPPRDGNNPPPRPQGQAGGGAGERGGRPAEPELPAPVDDIIHPVAGFTLSSPAVGEDGMLPKEFTGDGESASPPLAWKGVPEGTRSFVLIMHHIPPGGGAKWYWTLYDIPADVMKLEKNAREVGKSGTNSVNGRQQYAPPHSKGPGKKTYVLTLYALSSPVKLEAAGERIDRNALLTAMKEKVLGTATLAVSYDRTGLTDGAGEQRGPGGGNPPPRPDEQRAPPK